MPAMVWCTNLSDTMPSAQSCCMSSTGVDRLGSLHRVTNNAMCMDNATTLIAPEVSAPYCTVTEF